MKGRPDNASLPRAAAMDQSQNELCFVQFAGCDYKPTRDQMSQIRTHAMRDYLSKQPRRSRSQATHPTRRQTSTSGQKSAAIPTSTSVHAVAEQAPATNVTSSRELVLSKNRSSKRPLNMQSCRRLNAPITSSQRSPSIVSISSAAQNSIQQRDIFCRTFFQALPHRHIVLNMESLVRDPAHLPAITTSFDAAALLNLAIIHRDKGCLFQAMRKYERALFLMRQLVDRPKPLSTLSDVMLSTLILTTYEAMTVNDYLSLGYVQHSRALKYLLLATADCPPNSYIMPLRKLLQIEYFKIALGVGLASRRRTGINIRDIEGLLPDPFKSLFGTINKVPEMLEKLSTCRNSRKCRGVTASHEFAESLDLWKEIDTYFSDWMQSGLGKTICFTEIAEFPVFFNAMSSASRYPLESGYYYSSFEVLDFHRLVSMVLVVLGHDILQALQDPVPKPCDMGLNAAPAASGSVLIQHDWINDLHHRTAQYAENLCYMLPYIIDRMGGFGRIYCRGLFFVLQRYYLNPYGFGADVAKMDFLARVQDVFFLGSIIEKLLA